MPGGDRTGPLGAGPMTGRGAGFCAGYSMPGYMNPYFGGGFGFGRGRGRGFGRGRGWGWHRGYYASGYPGWVVPPGIGYYGYSAAYPQGVAGWQGMEPKDELAALQSEAKNIETALSDINRRIDELRTAEKKTTEKG